MKKFFIVFYSFLISMFILSCSKNNLYNVELILNNGSENIKITSSNDGYIIYNDIPIKQNYTFDFWTDDTKSNIPFNFTSKIKGDITLYAVYKPNYASITNTITQNHINSLVYIKSISYINHTQSFIDKETIGSGVIFKQLDNVYYILTNNHVCYTSSQPITYEIFDYKNNAYEGKLLYSNPDYDLALLSFEADIQLNKIDLANTNPKINDDIISLGNPLGQRNAITYGKINDIFKIITNNFNSAKINIEFDTISHNAYINDGSSGGPLLNTDLNLVGLNFAYGTNKNNEFISGHAIPVEKIKEFLSIINFQI